MRTPVARNLKQWVALWRRSVRIHHTHYRSKQRPPSPQRALATFRPRLRDPVFILGAPRSGTTFLGQCFSELDDFAYLFEPSITKRLSRRVIRQPERWLGASYHLAYHLQLAAEMDADLRLVEKTPRNCLIVDFLADQFPTAKFVLIVRDGRDAALSLREKPWFRHDTPAGAAEPGGYRHGPFPRAWVEPWRHVEFMTTTDLHRCIWSWRAHLDAAMAAGNRLTSDRWLTVRYEQLVSNPTDIGKRIYSFVDGPPSSKEDFLDRCRTAKASSVGRHKGNLTADEEAIIEQEAGPLLARLGYR